MDSETSYYTNILNIFIKHYNTFNKTNINMFTGLDKYEDTNDMMEEFIDHLTQFKESDDDEKRLYNMNEIQKENFEQLFSLRINENIVCVCGILFPILNYIATEIDWINVDWKIIPIDTQQ